jgi:hypothetical protein
LKLYKIKNSDKPLAVVLYDYVNGSYDVLTSSLAFKTAFDNCCTKCTNRLVGDALYSFCLGDIKWMDWVLKELCIGSWKVVSIEETKNNSTLEDVGKDFLNCF